MFHVLHAHPACLGLVLILGIQVSYIPQHLTIIKNKSSRGIRYRWRPVLCGCMTSCYLFVESCSTCEDGQYTTITTQHNPLHPRTHTTPTRPSHSYVHTHTHSWLTILLGNVSTCCNTINVILLNWDTITCAPQWGFLKWNAAMLSIYQV